LARQGRRRTIGEAHDQAAILPDSVIAVVWRRTTLVHMQIVHAASRREVEILIRPVFRRIAEQPQHHRRIALQHFAQPVSAVGVIGRGLPGWRIAEVSNRLPRT
jgi:hypothetical protein